jgi:hypothetical protein
MNGIFKALYEKLINYFREPEIITEIQCTPTFWRFIDAEKQPIFNWDMSETIQLIDNKKMSKLLAEHLKAENPDKDKIDIAKKTTWKDTEHILNHLIQDHFDEVKQKSPKNLVTATATYKTIVVGIKNILTGEDIVFPYSRLLIADDEIIYTIRTIEWNVIDEILKKEPA